MYILFRSNHIWWLSACFFLSFFPLQERNHAGISYSFETVPSVLLIISDMFRAVSDTRMETWCLPQIRGAVVWTLWSKEYFPTPWTRKYWDGSALNPLAWHCFVMEDGRLHHQVGKSFCPSRCQCVLSRVGYMWIDRGPSFELACPVVGHWCDK